MSRQNFVKVDEFGIDPLNDLLASVLENVTQSRSHTVSEDEVGHIGLIALREYDSTEEVLAFAILEYNALGTEFNLVAGQTIQIPNVAQIRAALSAPSTSSTLKRTVSI